MKRLFIISLSILFLSCTAQRWDLTFDILDIIVGDEVIHSDVVERVEYNKDSTTIHFESGISYEFDTDVCCPRYGKPGKVIMRDDGSLYFE